MAIDPSSILLEHPPGADAPPTHAHASAAHRALASSHAENFHVLSHFVPAALRGDFATVYAFCRAADDIADEHPHTAESRSDALERLADWRTLLDEADAFAKGRSAGPPSHGVFGPLAHTMRRRSLDAQPFRDLLAAFEQDQRVDRYETWDDLLDYCARSANPVGRIVLAMIDPPGTRSEDDRRAMLLMSDAVCTALQLANFWQDVRRDLLDRGRVYLPSRETGFDAATLRRWAAAPDDADARVRYIKALRPLVRRTRALLAQGEALPLLIADPDLSRVVRLFTLGCSRTLDAIERAGCATLWRRPAITKAGKTVLLAKASASPRRAPAIDPSPVVACALARCARTTRREARNFFWGLRLTPEPRRSALYAVYAWMRDADDEADNDDRALPAPDVAFARLARRRARLDAIVAGRPLDTAHHAWVGLAWAMRMFPVDPRDLASLLDGLQQDAQHRGVDSRDDLRFYCECVASTVGRVCLSIWGLTPGADARAAREKATSRGVAFQLTNILRDVGRDHAAGRVYVPRDDLARHALSAHDLARWRRPDACAALVADLAAWARREFASSDGLEAMIDPACAPSMRAMTEIYAGVLNLIERTPTLAVCEPRASLPLWAKVAIMARAAAGARRGRASR